MPLKRRWNGVFFSGIYPFPPTSSSRTVLCSQPYPADMPFRTLHRSSSPQKIAACALDFLRYGFTEKRNVLIQCRRIVIARQAAVCCGNPLSSGRKAEKIVGVLFIYTHPPPFNEAFPFREKRDVLTKIQRVIARQSADCRGNPYPGGDARDAEEVFIYTRPPLFKVSSPYGEDAGGRMNIRSLRIAQMMKNQSVDSTSRFSVRKSFIEGRRVGIDNQSANYFRSLSTHTRQIINLQQTQDILPLL